MTIICTITSYLNQNCIDKNIFLKDCATHNTQEIENTHSKMECNYVAT